MKKIKIKKSEIQFFNREKNLTIFDEKIEIRERCKGVHCVDLGESFPTSIYLQKSALRFGVTPRGATVHAGLRSGWRYAPLPQQMRRAGH